MPALIKCDEVNNDKVIDHAMRVTFNETQMGYIHPATHYASKHTAADLPRMGERFRLRLNFDAFNLFNHPDFDTPNNDVTFFPGFEPPPVYPPEGSLGQIQHTIGNSRFLQIALHLNF